MDSDCISLLSNTLTDDCSFEYDSFVVFFKLSKSSKCSNPFDFTIKCITRSKTAHPIGISYVLSPYLPNGSVSHVNRGEAYERKNSYRMQIVFTFEEVILLSR